MNELATTSQNKALAEAPLSPAQLVEQVRLIQEVMKSVMRKGEHYGTIPNCGPKPTFKPGAEKLQLTFRLHPDFEIQETDLPAGHKNFRVVCRLMNQSGGFQGAGVGYGSTRESKYMHKGGKETNPADFYNTVLKMSKKRAQVDAILTSTAASDIFTQDLEDMETLPKDKFIANKFPASQENDRGSRPPTTSPGARVEDPAAPESTYWEGKITDVARHQGENAKGPWTLFRVNMEDGNTATTFDEALAKDAEIMIGQEVRVLYEPNKRKPGTFTYKGFEPIPEPQTATLWPEEPKEEAPF